MLNFLLNNVLVHSIDFESMALRGDRNPSSRLRAAHSRHHQVHMEISIGLRVEIY